MSNSNIEAEPQTIPNSGTSRTFNIFRKISIRKTNTGATPSKETSLIHSNTLFKKRIQKGKPLIEPPRILKPATKSNSSYNYNNSFDNTTEDRTNLDSSILGKSRLISDLQTPQQSTTSIKMNSQLRRRSTTNNILGHASSDHPSLNRNVSFKLTETKGIETESAAKTTLSQPIRFDTEKETKKSFGTISKSDDAEIRLGNFYKETPAQTAMRRSSSRTSANFKIRTSASNSERLSQTSNSNRTSLLSISNSALSSAKSKVSLTEEFIGRSQHNIMTRVNRVPSFDKILAERESISIAQLMHLTQNKSLMLGIIIGPKDAGKTTLIKQMRVANNRNFSAKERIEFKSIIHTNIAQLITSLLDDLNFHGWTLKEETGQYCYEWRDFTAIFYKNVVNLPENMKTCIRGIWNDPSIKEYYLKTVQFKVFGSIGNLLNDIERILSNDYVPTDQDIIYARYNSTDIKENLFKTKKDSLVFFVFEFNIGCE